MGKTGWVAAFALVWGSETWAQGIAAGYPGDAGIENHPDVILVERFEDTVAAVVSRWTSSKNGGNLSLDTDVPPGSPGTSSLRITALSGTTGGDLYKMLSPGENDRLFLRYYVKYLSGNFHHSGGGLGGYNPPSPWPLGTAGFVPSGSDHFTVAFEPMDSNLRADFYVYWKDMTGIWGNNFIKSPSVAFTRDRWTCVEFMVKLNTPVSAANGELAVWIDAQLMGTFSNFQWRTVSSLNLNYVWMENYATVDPKGSLKFDHIVVARNYIGPLGGGGIGPSPSPAPAPSPSPSPVPTGGSSSSSGGGNPGGDVRDNPNGDGGFNDRACGATGAEALLVFVLLGVCRRR